MSISVPDHLTQVCLCPNFRRAPPGGLRSGLLVPLRARTDRGYTKINTVIHYEPYSTLPKGVLEGTTLGAIKRDIRSLDYSSYSLKPNIPRFTGGS